MVRAPRRLAGETGILKQPTKALVEQAMDAELSEHLGYDQHQRELAGFSDRILSTYPRGMTNREIVKHLKEIYLALAVNLEGKKELLGLWVDQSEGAKFWLGILSELKNRGVQDILIAVMDGLTGFPDAVRAMIARSWESRWTEIAPFLAYAPEIRKVMHSTNAIESLNYSIRKVTRNRQELPSADTAAKLVYMALQNISEKWRMPMREWS